MKDLKQSRFATRSPQRSVTLQIRDYQVTVKVKTPVAAEPPKHPVMLLGLLEVAPL